MYFTAIGLATTFLPFQTVTHLVVEQSQQGVVDIHALIAPGRIVKGTSLFTIQHVKQ